MIKSIFVLFITFITLSLKAQTELGATFGKRILSINSQNLRTPNQLDGYELLLKIKDKIYFNFAFSEYRDSQPDPSSGFRKYEKTYDRVFLTSILFVVYKSMKFSSSIGPNFSYRTAYLNSWDEIRSKNIGLSLVNDFKLNSRLTLLNSNSIIGRKYPQITFGISYRFGKPFEVSEQKKSNPKIRFS